MKRLVYTCVFGHYDRIFPPVHREDGVEYIVITDQNRRIPGWKSVVVDPASIDPNPRLCNRYFKIQGHDIFSDFDASIYLDGNIRVIGGMRKFFERLEGSDKAMGLYRHPARNTVREEVEQCVRRSKVENADAALAELQGYLDQGFPDENGCLIEASILLRNHRHPGLSDAMREWWRLYQTHRSRDQFSLPFVIWKSNLPVVLFEDSFRTKNPYFGWYPHANGPVAGYAAIAAKAHGSTFYRCLLAGWHLKWRLQRLARKQ